MDQRTQRQLRFDAHNPQLPVSGSATAHRRADRKRRSARWVRREELREHRILLRESEEH